MTRLPLEAAAQRNAAVGARQCALNWRWSDKKLGACPIKQLKVVSKLIEHPEDIDLDHTGALVDANFSCEALRPENANEVYERAL